MFLDSDLISIFGPALILAVIFIIGYKFWEGKKQDELGRVISWLKINVIAVGFLSIVLWLMLPSAPSLMTFGYPDSINEIQSQEQLLHLLQEYNKAIVRTAEVVHWFIFIFIWFFLTSLYVVIRTFKSLRKVEYFKKVKEIYST